MLVIAIVIVIYVYIYIYIFFAVSAGRERIATDQAMIEMERGCWVSALRLILTFRGLKRWDEGRWAKGSFLYTLPYWGLFPPSFIPPSEHFDTWPIEPGPPPAPPLHGPTTPPTCRTSAQALQKCAQSKAGGVGERTRLVTVLVFEASKSACSVTVIVFDAASFNSANHRQDGGRPGHDIVSVISLGFRV